MQWQYYTAVCSSHLIAVQVGQSGGGDVVCELGFSSSLFGGRIFPKPSSLLTMPQKRLFYFHLLSLPKSSPPLRSLSISSSNSRRLRSFSSSSPAGPSLEPDDGLDGRDELGREARALVSLIVSQVEAVAGLAWRSSSHRELGADESDEGAARQEWRQRESGLMGESFVKKSWCSPPRSLAWSSTTSLE